MVARTDGLSFHDDAPDQDEGPAAVAAATVLAVGYQAVGAFTLGALQVTTVRGPDGCVVVYPIDARHLLTVVTDPNVNLVLLDRVAQRLAAELAKADEGTGGSLFP